MTACDRWAAPTWPSSTPWATSATSGQSHSHSGKQISRTKVFNPFPSQVCWPDHLEAVHLRLWRPRYLFPFWQTLVKLQVRNLSTSLAGANIELCLYSVRKNLIRHFPGVSLANLNVTSLEHLGSPLAKANLVSLGNLENSNATSAKQSLLNLTAISSNFCHGTEQVCLRNWRCTIGLLMASHFQW